MTKVLNIDVAARAHRNALDYLASGADEAIIAPGKPGMRLLLEDGGFRYNERIRVFPELNHKDPMAMLALAKAEKPDLIHVDQDDALYTDMAEILRNNGFKVVGPSKKAAQIEWDKIWARKFMERHEIPVPEYREFRQTDEAAIAYAKDLLQRLSAVHENPAVFFKAKGLYEGKGVKKATKLEGSVFAAYTAMGKMGVAAEEFLVEEGIVGEEFSAYNLVNGEDIELIGYAQDNKTVDTHDRGENTGGMGANSRAGIVKGHEGTIETIVRKTAKGLVKEDRPYRGVLYLGGIVDMVRNPGAVIVLEDNARNGDPERLVFEIENCLDFMLAAAEDRKLIKAQQDALTRVASVGASYGYPGDYSAMKNKQIWFDYKRIPKGVQFFSYAINVEDDPSNVPKILRAGGGRLFAFVAAEQNVLEAVVKARQAMACAFIEDNGLIWRPDIAWRDVQRYLRGEL